MRQSVGKLLRSASHSVAEYATGTEFLASVAERPPLSVVLDLRMPVLNGFRVQEALARSGYCIAVIVMTADHTPENIARAMHLGATACLSKPVDADRLVEAIKESTQRLYRPDPRQLSTFPG